MSFSENFLYALNELKPILIVLGIIFASILLMIFLAKSIAIQLMSKEEHGLSDETVDKYHFYWALIGLIIKAVPLLIVGYILFQWLFD